MSVALSKIKLDIDEKRIRLNMKIKEMSHDLLFLEKGIKVIEQGEEVVTDNFMLFSEIERVIEKYK
jgi:hypothetical protein